MKENSLIFANRLLRASDQLCRFGVVLALLALPVAADEMTKVEGLLENYCYSCHDEWEQKGNIQLDELSALSVDAGMDLFNKIQEQLYFGGICPK